MIKAHNKVAHEHGFEMGPNQFMDLTNIEFKETYLGYIPPKSTEGKVFEPKNLEVPASVNWTA